MRATGRADLFVTTFTLAAVVACADPVSPPPPGRQVLAPFDGPFSEALIQQNDPSIGCPAHAERGYGFRTAFAWGDVAGADYYAVRFKRTGSQYPAIDVSVQHSSLAQVACNSFVIDANLTGWILSVAAIARRSNSATTDTLWREDREFAFRPCRMPSGRSCSAPPPANP
jgi:hypothetical protein